MSWTARVLRDRYVDSVRLMQVAQAVRGSDGVAGCELVMGTAANLEALRARGVDCEATPADVVIAVEGATGALDLAERELVAAPAATAREEVAQPRSLGAAARALDGANVALISVPGEYAVLEAHRALTLGLHVFLFSDHVGVADEVALKRRGAERGLLVMGPGCGTAMLGGTGLGFANVVRSGPIGIVAAAGTGAQEVAVLVDEVGVSQIVGVGGRDLTSEVGALMFREGMRALAADEATETLLLVSKPPDPDAVQALADVDVGGKRVVAAFVGWDGSPAPFDVHPTLEAAAFAAIQTTPPPDPDTPPGPGGKVLGLYSGGSLAHEAETILGEGHTILDLGEEEYTQGRPHPMVDLGVRLEMLRAVEDDVGCLLLDVVLGHGSHADPASELVRALPRERPVIAHVCGTAADPQDARRQEATLRDAGVIVAPTNASAVRVARAAAHPDHSAVTP
jgi:FdrA protein